MKKMDGKSIDLTAENIAQLKALFPEAVTEGKVDFEVLKALLGGEIEQRQEYYKFTWNGKEAARAYARTRSMGTLRPCVAESSGKDGTPGKFDSENLYIEGDNLEVLKLLQGPYHKKVKMIYIDPPYNTGKDFVYPDNFKDSIGNYKDLTGQTDDEGKSTRANPETSGRYHTDWLNMMYPRLILARNLLTDDGFICISIGPEELSGLQKIANDVFGEENYRNIITARRYDKNLSRQFMDDGLPTLSVGLDYILVYSKSPSAKLTPVFREANEERSTTGYWKGFWNNADRPSMRYDILGVTPSEGQWKWKKESADKAVENYKIYDEQYSQQMSLEEYWEYTGKTLQFIKRNISGKGKNMGVEHWVSPSEGILRNSNWADILVSKPTGVDVPFDSPKNPELLSELMQLAGTSSEIILDFFAGSSSTAHAVQQLNAEDGGNRKYIMVQLPEVCEAGTEAAKAGYANICEIGKERIRRAAKKIKGEHPDWNGDMGFKVFKLDTSNLLPWNPNADELEQNLFAAVDNVLEGRTTDDLLHEILLKCNLPLTLPIETKQCGSNTIYLVGAGALAICLDKAIPATIAEEIVKLRDEYAPIVPMQVVFRDNGFNDVTKTNALQILKQAGFEEKSIQTI